MVIPITVNKLILWRLSISGRFHMTKNLILAFFLSCLSFEAVGASLTLRIVGLVDGIGAQLSGGPVALGDNLSFTLTYDLDTPDSAPLIDYGVYINSITSAVIQAGDYIATTTTGHIEVGNGVNSDGIRFYSAPQAALVGENIGTFIFSGFDIRLRGGPGDTFDSEALPVSVFDTSEFFPIQARVLFLDGADMDPSGSSFVARSVSLELVPLPASLWLFCSALGLLSWLKRQQPDRNLKKNQARHAAIFVRPVTSLF